MTVLQHFSTALQSLKNSPRQRIRLARNVSAAFAALVFLVGCVHPGPNDPARLGPFYTPTNFTGDATLGGIRRVVLMPIWAGPQASNEFLASLDPVIAAALQHKGRFEVVTLSREDCLRRYGAEAISASGALPHDLLAMLRREFAADAVLFVDLTTYRAYRPLALGLRAKLATIDSVRLVWTFDNVFSADEPAVANSARHFFLESDTRGVPGDLTPAVLQSPSRFMAYAAAAMFDTLPPVTLPASAKTANFSQPVR
jgi:hypothetical protein